MGRNVMQRQDLPVLLSAPQAAQLLAISERRFHELRREAGFPQAVLIGQRCVRWHRGELVEYAQNLPRVSLLPEPPHLKGDRHGITASLELAARCGHHVKGAR
jgi:predicted DNA-binding transcriptional regulator AlpA